MVLFTLFSTTAIKFPF